MPGRGFVAKSAPHLRKLAGFVSLSDLVAVAGAGSITYGSFLVYEPAAYFVGGAFAIAAAVLNALRSE